MIISNKSAKLLKKEHSIKYEDITQDATNTFIRFMVKKNYEEAAQFCKDFELPRERLLEAGTKAFDQKLIKGKVREAQDIQSNFKLPFKNLKSSVKVNFDIFIKKGDYETAKDFKTVFNLGKDITHPIVQPLFIAKMNSKSYDKAAQLKND